MVQPHKLNTRMIEEHRAMTGPGDPVTRSRNEERHGRSVWRTIVQGPGLTTDSTDKRVESTNTLRLVLPWSDALFMSDFSTLTLISPANILTLIIMFPRWKMEDTPLLLSLFLQ